MANRNYNLVRGRGNGLTYLAGSFQLTGGALAAPTNVIGDWYTVTHTAVGLYLVTFTEVFPQILSIHLTAGFATGENYVIGVESQVSAGVGNFVIRLFTSNTGAPVDPTNNVANKVNMFLAMRNSTVP